MPAARQPVERLLAQEARANGDREFGGHPLVGHHVSAPMAALLRRDRVESDPFEARRLSEQMLTEADLRLSMTGVSEPPSCGCRQRELRTVL